jgi:hypothetical protein
MDDGNAPTLVRRHRGVAERLSAVTALLTVMALAAVVILVLLAIREA